MPVDNEATGVPLDPVGSVGTEIYSGYLSEEFDPELISPRERYELYHQMRSTSGTLNMCIKAVKDQIASARWFFKPKQGYELDADAEMQVEFFNQLFSKEQLDNFIHEVCTFTVFGFCVHELFYRAKEIEGKTYLCPKLLFLSQRTIERWNVDNVSGLESIEQYAYGDTSLVGSKVVPAENLIVTTMEREGYNYEGISFLRHCFEPWKRVGQNYERVAIGNNFLSIPFLKIYQTDTVLQPDTIKQLGTALARRVSGKKALSHIFFPPGVTCEETAGSFDPKTLYECIKYDHDEMVRAFSANFLLLTGSSGSHALSKDLSKFFTQGLESLAQLIDYSFQKIVDKTIEYNLGVDSMIKLAHSEIGGRGGLEFADALSKLFGSRILTPDEITENFVRDKFGLPEHDPETAKEDPTPPMFVPPNGEENINQVAEPIKKEAKPFVSNNDVDDVDDVEDEEEIELSKRIEMSPSGVKAQAERSVKRILKFREEFGAVYKEKMDGIIDKKLSLVKSFLKKKINTDDVYKINPKDLFTNHSGVDSSLAKIIYSAFDEEFQDVTDKILQAKNKTSARARLKSMVSGDIADTIASLDNIVIQELIQALDATNDINQVISMVRVKASTLVDVSSKRKATVIPPSAVNLARSAAFEAQYEEIESYTYFNPDPQADICKYLAGRTVRKDDPNAIPVPAHYNCSTVMLANMKSFKNNPRASRLAPSQRAIDSISVGALS